MARQTKTIIKEERDVADTNSPDVLAYRVGKLEEQQKEGFDRINKKLDEISMGFVTHADLEKAQAQARTDHDTIYKEIARVEKKSDTTQSWLTKLNWLVITAVIGGVMSLVVIK